MQPIHQLCLLQASPYALMLLYAATMQTCGQEPPI